MNSLKPHASFQVLIMSEESRLGREAIETPYALKQIDPGGRSRVVLPRGPRTYARQPDRQYRIERAVGETVLRMIGGDTLKPSVVSAVLDGVFEAMTPKTTVKCPGFIGELLM
jgi:hypothetical protein